jgi:hypothetical protein
MGVSEVTTSTHSLWVHYSVLLVGRMVNGPNCVDLTGKVLT